MVQSISSKSPPLFMILVWVKNSYRCMLTSNSLTGHRERLTWTTSRICGVRWRGQYRKPDLSSVPERAMSYGPLYQTRVMKLLRLSLTFGHRLSPRLDEWHQRSKHRSSGLFINPLNAELNPICHLLALAGAHHFVHVSRLSVKEVSSWNQPF